MRIFLYLKNSAEFLGAFTSRSYASESSRPAVLCAENRSFGHSMTLSIILLAFVNKVKESNELNNNQKILIQSMVAGYYSHLGLDSITPKSLPLII